jgi:hypothetical protein
VHTVRIFTTMPKRKKAKSARTKTTPTPAPAAAASESSSSYDEKKKRLPKPLFYWAKEQRSWKPRSYPTKEQREEAKAAVASMNDTALSQVEMFDISFRGRGEENEVRYCFPSHVIDSTTGNAVKVNMTKGVKSLLDVCAQQYTWDIADTSAFRALLVLFVNHHPVNYTLNKTTSADEPVGVWFVAMQYLTHQDKWCGHFADLELPRCSPANVYQRIVSPSVATNKYMFVYDDPDDFDSDASSDEEPDP